MKFRSFSFLCVLLMGVIWYGCGSPDNKSGNLNITGNSGGSEKDGPVIEFESLEHDFGIVHEGEKVGWYFKNKNVGNQNLIIRKADASCGCTVPDFSKEPLPPGEENMIKVVFDTSGRLGIQNKTITVETNDNKQVIHLKVIAEVIKK